MEHHIRQTRTHLHTHTSKDILNPFHCLSLFCCAVLMHNLVFGSFNLHIKRLIEKQLGFFPGQHESIYIHRHTFILLTSIMTMQLDKTSSVSEDTLVFIPVCGQSVKLAIGHPPCFAVLLKEHTYIYQTLT